MCNKSSNKIFINLIQYTDNMARSTFNTLRPRQDGRHFADDSFTCIFFNENCCIWIKFSLKYISKGPIDNNRALVQIMAWRRSCDKPLYEPMMIILPTHICVTRPQWVNTCKFWGLSFYIEFCVIHTVLLEGISTVSTVLWMENIFQCFNFIYLFCNWVWYMNLYKVEWCDMIVYDMTWYIMCYFGCFCKIYINDFL